MFLGRPSAGMADAGTVDEHDAQRARVLDARTLSFTFDEAAGYSPWEHPVETRERIVAFFHAVGAACGVAVEDLVRGEHVAEVANVRAWAELERRLVAAGYGVWNTDRVFVVGGVEARRSHAVV